MKDIEKIKSCYSQDLEQKKTWYSPSADAYNKVRPRYPKQIIERVVELAQLSSNASILEVGCGPGNATVAFANFGFSMVCLEPNQDFCSLARLNCTQYPNVEIRNTSFEEWQLEAERFDAVLAATSIHWVSPQVAYPKAAVALKDDGFLILLWNVIPEPSYEVYQVSREVYQKYAPSITQYKGREAQQEDLRGLGEVVLKSGKFGDLVSGQVMCEVTYSTDDYLDLLSTLSPYLKLEPQNRDFLFEGLREKLEKFGGSIPVSYLSAFQIARKRS